MQTERASWSDGAQTQERQDSQQGQRGREQVLPPPPGGAALLGLDLRPRSGEDTSAVRSRTAGQTSQQPQEVTALPRGLPGGSANQN